MDLPAESAANFHCSPAATQRDDGSFNMGAVTATGFAEAPRQLGVTGSVEKRLLLRLAARSTPGRLLRNRGAARVEKAQPRACPPIRTRVGP